MTSRTRFSKISAPPPGQESIPAALRSPITSTTSFFAMRAIQSISTIVHALRWTPGKRALSARQEVEIPGVGERRVEAADDVELRDAVVPAGRGLRDGFLDRHRVAAVHAGLPRPGAERAVDPAEVRRVQVAVDVVVADVPVLLLADEVRERADAEDVGRREERDAVLEREAPALGDLLGDRAEGRPGEALEEAAQSGMSPVEIGREMTGGACCSSTARGSARRTGPRSAS